VKKTFDVKAIILWDEKSNAEEKDFDHFAVLTLAVAVLSPSAFEAGKHCKGQPSRAWQTPQTVSRCAQGFDHFRLQFGLK